MRNPARRQQRGAITHSFDMTTPVRSAPQAHGLLPVRATVGGPQYGAWVAGLDWAMLALLVAVYGCTLVGYDGAGDADTQAILKHMHWMLGVGIVGLFGLRVLIRLIDREPPMQAPLTQWSLRAAKAIKWALYLFLLVMPLTGWLMTNALGQQVSFYGWVLPELVSPSSTLALDLTEAHANGVVLGYLLLGLNALAALYQHYAAD